MSMKATAVTDIGLAKQGDDEGQGLVGANGDDGPSVQEINQPPPPVQQPLLNPLYLAQQAHVAKDEKLNVFVGSGGMPGGMFYE